MPDVEFNLDPDSPPVDRELCEHLIQRMFAGQPEVQRVVLTNLPGGSAGLSSLAILLAHPIGTQASQRNPLLIRIGPKQQIDEEQGRYDDFVKPYIGLYHAQRQPEPAVDSNEEMAAVAYNYLHDPKSDQPLQTLRRFLGEQDNVDAAALAINKLFLETLAQGNRRNGWYNDARQYEEQQPLWLYNTMLPPAMTIEDVEVVEAPTTAVALKDWIALADSPSHSELHGQIVYLRTDDTYPHLRVVERECEPGQDRLRLYLYEQAIVPTELYQRPQAVAARIDLVGAPGSFGSIEDNLDGRMLQGRVRTTRYATLDHIRRHLLGSLPNQTREGHLRHGDMLLHNPILRYHTLLSQPRTLTISTSHGDLNLSNVLLSHLDLGREVVAWLIDFDKTGPGAHAIFDAVKLETEYKLHILPHRLRTIDEFIELERALHQALLDPEKEIAWNKDNIALRDAYQFIATIRRTVLCELPQKCIQPVEYYLGLLAYGLAALKYQNLYSNTGNWLTPDPYVKPLAVAAYLSASFAASVIDACEDVVATAESYPPIRLSKQRLLTRPQLIGRDGVLAQARRHLRGPLPVVLLYGQPGSGRSAVATALCAELQRSGYTLLTWPSFQDRFMTVEAFLLTLVALLREQRVGKLPLRLRQPQSALRLDERVAWLKRIREQLTATLEGSAQPLLLFIQLVDADAELCAFVTELAAGLHRTTLVLVADQPLAELPAEAAIEIAPFSLDDVSRFVRYEQLPLDQAAIDHLFKASYGLPRLLKRIVEGASGDMVQHDGTLQAAVMQIPLYRHIDEWGRAIVRRQPEGVRRLFELDAVLHAYSPDALPEDESFYESAIEAAGWVAPGAAAEVLAAYQNHPLHQYGSLTALLRRQALVQAQLRPTFPQLCLRIAHFYREQRPTDFYLVARYQSLAGQWQHAAATLAEIVPKPMYIYTARCGQLYALLVNIFERAIVYDELSLLELAGNCAAYLGQYSEAAGYYERLLAKLPADKNQRYLRLLARLLQVYEAAEDDTQARQTCKLLFRHAQLTDPLYALGRAYEGRARLLEAPAEATPILLEAIAILEQTRDRWGDEHLFYEEERLMFYDALAQAEAMQGRADAAIAHLQTMRPIAADLLNDPALVARIDNNLGYVYYYVRAHTKDPEFARVCFEDALRRRRKIGDRVGQIRTAQNLANLLSDLARNASDWEQAEAFFEEFEALADTKELAQIAQRELIIVNHLDALVDRGAFLKAKTLFENVRLDRVRSSNTRAFLFLNRAKLALWEEDAAACTEYLALASPLINDFEASMNKIEWAQLALECHLLLGTALEPIAEMWGAAVTVDIEDRPIDAAKCLYVQALLASSRAAQAESLRLFEQSRQLFSDAGYRYRAAVCALWEARIATQANDAAATKRCIELAETLLLPFGETPALQRLRRLVLSHIREV